MESILLGGLALAGFNSNKTKINSNKAPQVLSGERNSFPKGSNISGTMNTIQQNQARNLVTSIQKNKPDYFKQFDELRFDNVSVPVSMNESHITVTGVNASLQRNLDLNNGYSSLIDPLSYGVISREHFTHNNMTPNTSKRDYTTDGDRSSRKLESFTGVSEFYVPKQEKYNLFEPLKDLTYVNGMPVMTDYLDSRYLASSKNNMGNLPFQNNVKVRPGLDGETRQGLGTVYRVNPRTVDDLRGEQNQKVTYENKPLETVKKGDYRAPDFNLTKYKMPDFRETKYSDLVQGKSQVTAPMQTGKFTDINTQRGDSDINYQGPANHQTMGEGPSKNKTRFEPSKRQEGYNDPTHAISGVNIKPVMQNISSYVNRETQRVTTNSSQTGVITNTNKGSYSVNPNYTPATTIKELMINGDTNLGVAGSTQRANYVFSNDMVLPTTIRETTAHNRTLGPTSTYAQGSIQLTDNAKQTVKETTMGYRGGFANPIEKANISMLADNAKSTIKETTIGYRGGFANPTIKSNIIGLSDKARTTINETTIGATPSLNVVSMVPATYAHDDTDIAKTTIRQTTEANTYQSNVNQTDAYVGYTRDLKEKAKVTIKQTTLYTTPGKNITSQNGSSYVRDLKDNAKTTIKETTHLTDYTGAFKGDVEQPMSHMSANNMTIDDRREVGTFNRTSGGGANLAGPQINKNTIKINTKKTSIYYVSNAGKGMDHSVMPCVDQSQINKKTQLDIGDYYTNNVFINTLKDNPLVNDIHHQKNV